MSDCNPHGLVVLSRNFQVMSVNAVAAGILENLRPGDTCRPDRIFCEADLAAARAVIAAALDGGRPDHRCLGRVRTGRRKTVLCEFTVQHLCNDAGEVIGLILRLQPAAPLRTENVFAHTGAGQASLPSVGYRTLYEGLPQGAFTVDLQRRITSFNRAAETITGYSKAEAIGRRCSEVFHSDRCRRNCPLTDALKSGKSCRDQQVQALHRSGSYRSLTVSAGAVRDDRGKVRGALELFLPSDPYPAGAGGAAAHGPLARIIGDSPPMRRLVAMLPSIAASDACVLICGETGTGKDRVAATIHELSARREGPFVPVNCSALAETLLESELFGHEKGAFTGAEGQKTGRLEMSAGGSLFLDEIGELKPGLQVKLLRVLDQGSFERVGGIRPLALSARVISATNQDLAQSMQCGRFRKDLFFRLRTVALHLPPLRDRREDIPLLTAHFIRRCNRKTGKNVRIVDPKVMGMFQRYRWPGNVRELERVIEHAFVFVKGPVIFPGHLPTMDEFDIPKRPAVGREADDRQRSRATVLWALSQTDGNRREAAALLGISRTSMWRRMKALGLLPDSGCDVATD